MDHILKQTLKPLSSLKTIDSKDITDPYLFKSAAMVTTFVRLAGNRTKELWHFLEGASRADVMLADLRHQSLKKMRRLRPGETVDILAELRKLATQFGGMTERGLVCAFIDWVAGACGESSSGHYPSRRLADI